MAESKESWDGSYDDSGSISDDSSYYARLHIEPIYDSFLCPLTKQVMRDPVTIESGQTFERAAIEMWFKECKESRRRPICPMTLKELRNTDLNPSIALRNTIEEWTARNEAVQLDMARKSLNLGSPEKETLGSLKYVQHVCQKGLSRHIARNAGLIPMIVSLLKSTSRKVQFRALETLRIVVQEDNECKDILAEGDTLHTVVKFLRHEHSKEKEEAVALLYELSKSEALCEEIGSVNGAILILVGMSSSKSENISTVENADRTLENLEKCENNIRQMAEYGRLKPLLTQILEGPPETKHSMAAHLGELVLNNDVKLFVAQTVGSSLINIMRSGDKQSKEAALKALNQISSFEASARVLVQEGILPPLVKDLFAVGSNPLPMKLKEVSATILANVVSSGCDFNSIPVEPNNQTTLVSEDTVHNLLQLISNTGPAIECKLLQVLVGLTSSPSTISSIVDAIRSSGAVISLVQFIEAPQLDLRVSAIKLLQNISPHLSQELADALRGSVGQLSSLFRIIAENTGITEEQAAAVRLLADLPEMDFGLSRQMLDEGAFELVYLRIVQLRQGETRGGRFLTPFLEGLVRILARITFLVGAVEPGALEFCRSHNLAALFIELLQSNGLENVQMASAMALENLSQESKNLTQIPTLPEPGFCASIFPCLCAEPVLTGLCPLHRGTCSLRESFCLLEGKAVDKLVALLDHTNEKVVEAALAALSTLLDDGVDVEKGVKILDDADGVQPIFNVLLENRTENLMRRAVWTVERLLRMEDIAIEFSNNPKVSTALVDAFQHGDYRTRQIAERALRHVDKLPNFSNIFPNPSNLG
ncbi:U-box domain-containing protein 44-like [Benincasa hispida]|uniref:U-box domain-containing protein 44-like n=1 Tax=Benincasa hispida TaxID=102211 RepID=UPI001902BAA9|nr:U-box domain-containing protein 44-like [Benincasa hispida]